MRTFLACSILLGLVAILGSCRSDGQGPSSVDPLFLQLDSSRTGLDFVNRVADSETFNVFSYRNYYNGGGVAIGDLNNDGLNDIYFTANLQANRLYLNRGDWQFEDVTEQAGVGGNKAWSTGVSLADVNGDGHLDIYVCNSGDIAGDNKTNELFINQGDGTFTEAAAAWGLADPGFSTHASFFDYDADGDLDCYLLNNSFKDNRRVRLDQAQRDMLDPEGGDKLFRNEGDRFVNVTGEAGIYGSSEGFGLGVSVSDLNGDLRPDIYISNDFWERDYLYINQGDGTFTEELTARIGVTPSSSMGADIADLDNDGWPEIFTTDMLPGDNHRTQTMMMFDPYFFDELNFRETYYYQMMHNGLQVNQGLGRFQERAFLSGLAVTDWSWGALLFDFDQDGRCDVFVSNGIYHDITDRDFTDFVTDRAQVRRVVEATGRVDTEDMLSQLASNPLANYAFMNTGGLRFANRADELGLATPSFSNGSAYGDLDNDGDLDLVINNLNMPCFAYRNQANERGAHHWLAIDFRGPSSNAWGIGARVTLTYDGQQQQAQHYLSRGFQSSVGPGLHFGLGEATRIDQLEVVWPDGARQVLREVAADQQLTLHYEDAKETWQAPSFPEPAFLDATERVLAGDIRHEENTFNDFDYERLLLRMLSTEGPRLVPGDFNGDGLDDVVLLGARGMPDRLFVQTAEGNFRQQEDDALTTGMQQESTCGYAFDADADGDTDLLIGAGGNEGQRGPESFLVRLYLNDGTGHFKLSLDQFPNLFGNLSTIEGADMDGDGDIDLFLGARSVPGNYGLAPRHWLLRNEGGGRWNDLTNEAIGTMGMVTDAAWTDINMDGAPDLVVVGDWMPVTVFFNENGMLGQPRYIANSAGWWNRLEATDLDGDGREDLIAGNWGLNSKFSADPDHPLTMYVKDFDGNGKSEFIINWRPPLEEELYPFASKNDLVGQMPALKKRALTYAEYAQQSYESLFTAQQRQGALKREAAQLATGIFWNKEGGLRWQALPDAAQVAPVYAIVADDLDADGHTDIWLGGNLFAVQPAVGHLSANHGVWLRGDSQGNWQNVPSLESGFFLRGEVRDALWLSGPSGRHTLLIARNNESMLAYRPRTDTPLQ